MCEPITIAAAISATAAVASGVMSAQTAKSNQAALNRAADDKQEVAKYNVEQANRKYERTAGTIIAGIGTTGLDITSFSDVLADDAAESALEKWAIKSGAQTEARNLRFQASGQGQAATNALVGSAFSAANAFASARVQQTKLDTYAVRNKGVWLTDTFAEG